MRTKVQNLSGCARMLIIEVPCAELSETFSRVYKEIGKLARVPGYRPGHVPRDLLETHYRHKAEQDVVKQAIPEYYLKAVEEEKLVPMAAPKIENVTLNNQVLKFSAKIDVKPQLRLKAYKQLRLTKKKSKIGHLQVDLALEKLRTSRAQQEEKKEKAPELNDEFAKGLGFSSVSELRAAVEKDLQTNAQRQIREDLEQQIVEQLLQRASLDVPQSLVQREKQELLNQFKLNQMLHGGKEEEVGRKAKEWEPQAEKEATRRVKLSFILEEISWRENIQVDEQDLDQRMITIAQRSGRNKDELRQQLERQNLIPALKQELRNMKAVEYLIREAKVVEEK